MTTLNHLVYDIKNIIYGGIAPDDANISNRQIAYWVNQIRALLIRQEFSKRTVVHDSYVQFLTINLENVSTANCTETGCTILRSTQALPDTIRRGARNTILSVASLTGTQAYTETTAIRAKWNSYNKYTGGLPRWYVKNGFLYITNTEVIEKLEVGGVFEDPTELGNFMNCDGAACFTWDDEYPISADMAGMITDIILKNKVGPIASNIKGDDTNDAQDEKVR